MKKVTAVILMVIAFVFCSMVQVQAQTPPTPPDPLENAWAVTVQGGYSYTGGNTNNGVMSSVALRVAQHLNVRNDLFTVATTPILVNLVKVEYNFSLAHLVPSNSFINTANLQPFINAGAGVARGTTGTSKLAYGIGGGLDVYVSPLVTVRPLDVTWIRGQLFNGVVGNHMQLAASVGFTFGGNPMATVAHKLALKRRGRKA